MTDAASTPEEQVAAAQKAVADAQAALAAAQAAAATPARPAEFVATVATVAAGSAPASTPSAPVAGPLDAAAVASIRAGYAFDALALEMGALVNGEAVADVPIRIPI